MLAVVRTHRTNLRMRGFIPSPVLRVLRHEFGKNLTVTPETDDEKLESVVTTAENPEFKKRASPADYLRTYRETAGFTQCELAEKLNVARSYICDLEHGRRTFSKQFAKKVAAFFTISVEYLI